MAKGQRAGESAIAVNIEEGISYYWCSCGKSSKQPFCDGSHKGSEFNPVAYKAEIKILPIKSNILVISYLLCEPSQNGGLLVCLQAQKNIFFVASALYTTGLNSEPLCELSQKGCLELLPQLHQ